MKTFIEYIDEELTPVKGTQYGSNDGGVHVDDESKKKYYIKNYKDPHQAKVEVLTGKIYNHMGIKTLNPSTHGETGVKSEWNSDVGTMHPKEFENLNPKQAGQIGKMYHAGILTKNWDIVGMEHDNIVKNHKTGDLHAIDHGGSFHYRAQGGHKEYDPSISEKESLRNNNFASGHVFSSVFKKHPEAEAEGLKAVKSINDKHIHGLFKKSGLPNWKDLHHNFMERKKKLVSSYEE